MAPARKDPLRALSLAEQTTLERLSKATSERVDRVRRARALLAVAQGASYPQAAEQAGLSRPRTVYYLVQRFNARGLAALAIAAGRGRPPTYDVEARAQIVATVQPPPQRRPDGTASWSLSTRQRHLRAVDAAGWGHLSTDTIRRVLQEAGSAYQRTRSWCPTGTARRKRRGRVLQVSDPQAERKRG
jgi:transposase